MDNKLLMKMINLLEGISNCHAFTLLFIITVILIPVHLLAGIAFSIFLCTCYKFRDFQ